MPTQAHSSLAKHAGPDILPVLLADTDEGKTLIKALIRDWGFIETQKLFRRLRPKKFKQPAILNVIGGIVEVGEHGQVDASLEIEGEKRLVVQNAVCTDSWLNDVQTVQASESPLHNETAASEQLLTAILDAGEEVSSQLVCEAEFTQFAPQQADVLLPLLWKYIITHRQSNDRNELVAVGSAIRKYVAIMPANRMGELSTLLVPANHEPLPLELELEVAKMIYRNFEAFPPPRPNPEPELASRLWEMAKAYINPRILLRDKHSAVASLAIEAIVAMRSEHAVEAWKTAIDCQYHWFGEMVDDDLLRLRRAWSGRDGDAVRWLDDIRAQVAGDSRRAEHS